MLLHSKGEGEPGCPAPRRCHPRLTDCSPERPGHSENRWRRGGHRDHNPGRPPGWKGTTHPPERPGTGLPHTGSLLGFPMTGPSSPGPTPERTRFGCQQRARFLAELPSSAARTGGPRPPPPHRHRRIVTGAAVNGRRRAGTAAHGSGRRPYPPYSRRSPGPAHLPRPGRPRGPPLFPYLRRANPAAPARRAEAGAGRAAPAASALRPPRPPRSVSSPPWHGTTRRGPASSHRGAPRPLRGLKGLGGLGGSSRAHPRPAGPGRWRARGSAGPPPHAYPVRSIHGGSAAVPTASQKRRGRSEAEAPRRAARFEPQAGRRRGSPHAAGQWGSSASRGARPGDYGLSRGKRQQTRPGRPALPRSLHSLPAGDALTPAQAGPRRRRAQRGRPPPARAPPSASARGRARPAPSAARGRGRERWGREEPRPRPRSLGGAV